MANERLGIFEELQAAREHFNQVNADRQRLLKAGPLERRGPYAQPYNPFVRRMMSRTPFWQRKSWRGLPRRTVWPEASLQLNVVQVVQAVAIESGLGLPELMGPSHKRFISGPRHVAFWMVDRYCPEYSLPDIGYMFNRDHTSILHGIEATTIRLADRDVETKALVANVKQRLSLIAAARAE